MLCFLLRWPDRFLALFARFVCFFLSPFALNASNYYYAFLLRCHCRFCLHFGSVAGVAFFSLCPSVMIHVKQYLPCALPYPRLTHFPFPSVPQHPYAPFQPMWAHLHSLHAHTYGYVCVGACACFCMVVGRTVCARVVVIALAGGSALVFCVYLAVYG